jgi:hypothetical protein
MMQWGKRKMVPRGKRQMKALFAAMAMAALEHFHDD